MSPTQYFAFRLGNGSNSRQPFPRHVSMNSLPMRFLKECHFIELSPTFTEDNSVPMGFR